MTDKLNLDNLNPEQYQAVTASMGPILVVAGAGTGKTSVLTKRIAYLIEHEQFNPDRILAITFTNKAALEMNERVSKLVNMHLDWIGTFHGICIKILRQDIHVLDRNPNFKIIDDEEATVLLKDLYETNHFSVKDLSYKNAVSLIDKIKTYHITKDKFLEANWFLNSGLVSNKQAAIFWNIYEQYLQRCETLNLLDFNDILSLTYELLSSHEEVRQYWSHQFDYVLVDEFQDTNDIQYQLVKLLVNENNNLFVVGDPDQTIYTWRGAKQSIINNFNFEYPSCQVIILNRNYRSNQAILNAANKLIAKNTNRIHKDLIAANNVTGDKPLVYVGVSADNEALWVAREIEKLKLNGVQNNEIAILYRSNYLSRPIEQALVQYNFRYTIYGGFKFYQRTEIKDMLAYLSAIANHDEISLRRIINTPSRRISDVAVQGILSYAHDNQLSFWTACEQYQENPFLTPSQKKAVASFVELIHELEEQKDLRLDKLVVTVMKAIGYQQHLEHMDKQNSENKLEYIEELLNAMTIYMERNPDWTLRKYLQDITLFISSDDKNNNKDTINLMTVHTSKGLEFNYVFIVGFIEGIFPSKKNDNSEALQEERRIAYVALTRAKERLAISCNTDYSPRLQAENRPSSFLGDIGNDNLNYATKPNMRVRSNLDLEFFDSTQYDVRKDEKYFVQGAVNNYKVGDQVVHTLYGLGLVIGMREDVLEIRFDHRFGVKNIVFNHKSIKRSLS